MSKDEYLITDTPLKALTVFAMPMILGSFFQQIYNMADSIIVGQFVGSSALAAVGACAEYNNMIICVALGAGVGAGVNLLDQLFASKYSPWCFWLFLRQLDDERTANPCRHTG